MKIGRILEKARVDTIIKILSQIRLRKVTRLVKGERVVDIGCGDALLKKVLPKGIGTHYVGLDYEEKLIVENKKNYPDCDFYVQDVEKNPIIPGEEYDTAVMGAFLQLLSAEGELTLLKNIFKVLRKDGLLIFTVPTLSGERVMRILKIDDVDKYQHFSKKKLINLVESAGFKVIKHKTFEFGFNQMVVAKK